MYKCYNCEKEFNNKYNLKRHLLNEKICKSTNESIEIKHKQLEEIEKRKKRESKKITIDDLLCPICNKTFSTKFYSNVHKKKCNKKFDNDIEDYLEKYLENNTDGIIENKNTIRDLIKCYYLNNENKRNISIDNIKIEDMVNSQKINNNIPNTINGNNNTMNTTNNINNAPVTNNTTNNTTNNININIQPFGSENIDFLSDNNLLPIILKNYSDMIHMLGKSLMLINFNEEHQENWNICLHNEKDDKVLVFNGTTFVDKEKNKSIDEMIQNTINIIKDKFKKIDYDEISGKYLSKVQLDCELDEYGDEYGDESAEYYTKRNQQVIKMAENMISDNTNNVLKIKKELEEND